MKITNVEVVMLVAPIDQPWTMGSSVIPEMAATLVRIDTDEGISGWGECIVRLAPQPVASIVEHLIKPILLGRDPLHIQGLWDDLYRLMQSRGHWRGMYIEAIAGVDIALWDILGHYTGLPVHVLLGSRGGSSIPVYASSVYIKEIPAMVVEAEELVDKGFTAVKLKIGKDPRWDVEMVRAIREAVGPQVRLMVDANCSYDRRSALWVGRRLEELDMVWFEEPLPPEDIDGQRRLAEATDIPLAAGETEFTRFGFRDLVTRAGVDIVQPNVARAGGFSECMKIIGLASAHGVRYAPHTGASSAITLAASLHLAAAAPNFFIFEYMFPPNPLRETLLADGIPEPRNGLLALPEGPGIAATPSEEAIQRFRIH